MKRSRRQGSPKILKTDLPSLLLSWLKGVWGSLRRFVMRLLRPNQGRRKYIELRPEKPRTCPLVGVEGSKQARATVADLMGTVQWQPQEATPGTFVNAIVADPKVRSRLQPDKPHISPLVGIERFQQSIESLTVANLMETVQWNSNKKMPEALFDSIAAIPKVRSELQLDKPHISPLVGIEKFSQAESLSVGDLMQGMLWQSSHGKAAKPLADLIPASSVALDQKPFANNTDIRPLVCPLLGVELSYTESLTVGNLMSIVQWQVTKKVAKVAPKPSPSPDITSIQGDINWD